MYSIKFVFAMPLILILFSQLFLIVPPVNAESSISNAELISSGKIDGTWAEGYSIEVYYKINVLAGQQVSILLGVPSGSDLDLFLLDPGSSDNDEIKLDSSKKRTGEDESIDYTASKSGLYYLKISGRKYSGTGNYDLKIFVTQFEILFSDWGTQEVPIEVAPGDLGSNLNVIIRHGGSFDIIDVSITMILPQHLTNRTGGNMLFGISSTTLKSGNILSFNFLVDIDDNAKLELLKLPLIINYKTIDSVIGSTIDREIKVQITGRSFLKITSNMQTFSPNQSNDLELIITNDGTRRTGSVDFSITIPPPLSLLGSDNKWKFSSLSPNGSVTLQTSIFAPISTAGQTFQLICTMIYTDSFGNDISETRTINIRIDEMGRRGIVIVDAFWGSGNNKINVEPGDKGVGLTIIIQNRDSGPVSGIQGTLTLTDPFTTNNDNFISNSFGNVVSSGSTTSAEFLININNNADLGTYTISIDLSYLDKDSILRSDSLLFSINIEGVSDIGISLDENVFFVGTLNNLVIDIDNIGSAPVYSLKVLLSYSNSQGFLSTAEGDTERKISLLESGNSESLTFKTYVSPNAQQGLYFVTITVSYRTANGEIYQEIQEIGIVVKEDCSAPNMIWLLPACWSSPISILVPDNILQSGRVTKSNIIIQNIDDKPISNLVIDLQFTSVQNSFPIFLNSGSSIWKFLSLDSSESITISPEIFTSLSFTDSSFPIQISISYLDVNGIHHDEIRQIGFTIRGNIDIESSSVTFSPIIIPSGGNASLIGSILNMGDKEAQFLTLSIASSDFIITNSESIQYIGEVDPDSLIPFSLKFQVSESSPNGQIPIELVFSYDDSYGNTYTISEFFNLTIDRSIFDSISSQVQNCPESNNLLLPGGLSQIFLSPQDDCPNGISQFFSMPLMIGTGIFIFIIVILLIRRRSNNNQPF